MTPQSSIVRGLARTTASDVSMAVSASTSRSISMGMEMTLTASAINEKAKPTRLPSSDHGPAAPGRQDLLGEGEDEFVLLRPVERPVQPHRDHEPREEDRHQHEADREKRARRACLERLVGVHQLVSSPASRRRLSSYRPIAANGPMSANPEASGNSSGMRSCSKAKVAMTSPAIG